MPKITINNTQFYYELNGQGHPLILIAGYTCDHSFWDPILEKLHQKFQVLVFDNRAVGQTRDSGEKTLSAELLADDVIALAQALKLQKPHIVGHSMGGTIAQSIGARYSKEIGKLVILSSCAKWRQATLLGTELLLTMHKNNYPFDLTFNGMISWIFGEAFLQNKENVQALKELIVKNPYPQSSEDQERQFQILQKFDGRNQLKNILAPTLVAYGVQDLLALPYEAEFMASHIPNVTLVPCNSAHGLIAEIPQEIANLLIDFLM